MRRTRGSCEELLASELWSSLQLPWRRPAPLLLVSIPSSEEVLNEMMKGADVGDKDGIGGGDGKIDLREFLVFFAKGLKDKRCRAAHLFPSGSEACASVSPSANAATPACRPLHKHDTPASRLDRNISREDVLDAYSALGGDKAKGLDKEKLHKMLAEEYGLDVDVNEAFETLANKDSLTLQEFENMLLSKSANNMVLAA